MVACAFEGICLLSTRAFDFTPVEVALVITSPSIANGTTGTWGAGASAGNRVATQGGYSSTGDCTGGPDTLRSRNSCCDAISGRVVVIAWLVGGGLALTR